MKNLRFTYLSCVLVALALFIPLKAMEPSAEKFNTYKGVAITAENLMNFAPEMSSEVPELQDSMTKWVNKNPDFITAVVRQPGSLNSLGQKMARANAHFAKKDDSDAQTSEQKIKNLSNNNYVFESVDPNYLAKVSGPVNRYLLQTYAKAYAKSGGFAQYRTYSDAEILAQGWDLETIKTYQTASRLFYWLRAKEAIETQSLTEIEIPQMYLMPLDTTTTPHDENCMVLERKIGSFNPGEESATILSINAPDMLTILNKDRLVQLMKVMKYAGLWNVSNNILYNTQTRKLNLVDFEQPNTLRPHELWNANTARYGHSICTGMQELCGMLPKGSPQREVAVEFIVNDKDITGAYNYSYDLEPKIK